MAFALLILCIVIAFITLRPKPKPKAIVRKCLSVDCGHNVNCLCKLPSVDIYDNGVLGICLWHTSSMQDRVADAFTEGRKHGKTDGKIELVNDLLDKIEDSDAIKNPNSFADWMRKRLKGKS